MRDCRLQSTIPGNRLYTVAFVIVLLAAIGAGTYYRLSNPHSNVPDDDEFWTMIPAIKLNVTHTNYDPRLYNFHHPFLGFKLLGLLIDKKADYTNTIAMPPNLLYYSYLSAEEIRAQEAGMRFMLALFGILLLLPVFLIGRELYGNLSGVLAAALVGVFVGFINLSKVVIQDAFLPFFMFMAIYFGIKYLKTSNEEKIFSIEKPILYFFATLIFTYLSFMVRLGQPLLVSIALLIAVLMKNEKKYKWWFFYSVPFMAVVIILSFGLEPFSKFLELRGSSLAKLMFNTGFFQAAVSQGSYSFLLLLLIAVYYAASDFWPKRQKQVFSEKLSLREIRDRFGLASTDQALEHIERDFEYRKDGDLYTVMEKKHKSFTAKLSDFFWSIQTEKKFLLMLFVLMLAFLIFTETGALPRIYMFFFVLPIIFLSGMISRFTRMWQYALVCIAIIIDIASLGTANPNFIGYTVILSGPGYLPQQPWLAETNSFMEQSKAKGFLTNDPALILRSAIGKPLPPAWNGFRESSYCTAFYFASLNGQYLVYRPSGGSTLSKDQYICPEAAKAVKTFVKNISDGGMDQNYYQIFRFD